MTYYAIGMISDRIYYSGQHHADISRWIASLASTNTKHLKTNLPEPLKICRSE